MKIHSFYTRSIMFKCAIGSCYDDSFTSYAHTVGPETITSIFYDTNINSIVINCY